MTQDNTETFPELDIRRSLSLFLQDKNRDAIAKKVGMRASTFSSFRRGYGGINWRDLVRLITVVDYSILDPYGRAIIGDPLDPEKIKKTAPDILHKAIVQALEDKNMAYICRKASISPPVLSKFRNGSGGIEWQGLIRLLILIGFRILDHKKRLLLGDPDRRDQELTDNYQVAEPEQEESPDPSENHE